MSSSSRRRPASDHPPESYEICGVQTGLLGCLSSTSGVEMVATVGMLNNKIENLVTSDRILFGFTARIPANSAVRIERQNTRPHRTPFLHRAGRFRYPARRWSPGFIGLHA
jgi:hypothetical protein